MTNSIGTGNCPRVREEIEGATHIKLPTENVIILTWNVRTLNQCGKLKELTYALDKYRWDIIGLSETHFNKCGEITTEDRHGFWFSSDGERQLPHPRANDLSC